MSELNTHAIASPSGADGWFLCAGKLAMEKGLPDDSNEHSEFGTAGHEVAKMCLTADRPTDPAAFLGRRIEVGAHKTVEVVADMVAPVRKYVQGVHAVIERYKLAGAVSVEAFYEQRVPVGHITGEEGAEGTADTVLIVLWPDGTALIHVTDLKLGVGVKVYAEENRQGMLYALGAVEKFSYVTEFHRVVISIHQPRVADEPSEWECSIEHLMKFAADAKFVGNHALHIYHNIARDKLMPYLTPGDHCKKTFCKARDNCPKRDAFVRNEVGEDFEVISEMKPEEAKQFVEVVKQLDGPTLAQKFKAIDTIEDWCRAVRAAAEKLLLDSSNAPEVIAELGIKLVQGKQGNRAWSDPAEVETIFKSMRLKTEEIFDMKIISPTAAEKLLKETPKRWKRVESLITRADGKPSVVPASDRRPALVMAPVSDDFAVVTEDVSDLA